MQSVEIENPALIKGIPFPPGERFREIIVTGPPGSGKTMLSKRLPSILPPMTLNEALETTKIHSVIGNVKDIGLMTQRPFRAPHHTISDVILLYKVVKLRIVYF